MLEHGSVMEFELAPWNSQDPHIRTVQKYKVLRSMAEEAEKVAAGQVVQHIKDNEKDSALHGLRTDCASDCLTKAGGTSSKDTTETQSFFQVGSGAISVPALKRERALIFQRCKDLEQLSISTNSRRVSSSSSSSSRSIQKRRGRRPSITSNRNTETESESNHGPLQEKSLRARMLCEWMLATFGQEALQRGSGVIDVAGGKGRLTLELQLNGVPCTLVDPGLRKRCALKYMYQIFLKVP